jgi:hypothetical protein
MVLAYYLLLTVRGFGHGVNDNDGNVYDVYDVCICTDMPEPRSMASAVIYRGKLVVVGGYSAQAAHLSSVIQFDFQTRYVFGYLKSLKSRVL